MSTIEDLLARSLLLHQPHVPSDVVPYEDCLDDDRLPDDFLWDEPRTGPVDENAAQSLAALCEAVLAHSTADQLADFLTDQVPQPRTARILGCALQLAGADDGARFWWQYAAGADDTPASYCLYLQHRAQGDPHAAALWRTQATALTSSEYTDCDEDESVPRVTPADASPATVLRILSGLTRTTPRRHTPTAQAVIEFVAAAVAIGYARHPDLEIPLPGTNFAEQLEVIIAAASSTREHSYATEQEAAPLDQLPNRLLAYNASRRAPVKTTRQDPEHLLVKVTTVNHEPASASAHNFFQRAAAICWKTATAADNTGECGTRIAYHLRRFAQRYAPAPSGFGRTRSASLSSAAHYFHG
ncbi:hypothetical protein ACGFYV_35800 [Streptomyces sp. NPDC048297]|uniref:hypothetical protein n=1 Tax=Streptomyces sp. NPDC048297 TaxID=3365531 RepID=UPI003721E8E0